MPTLLNPPTTWATQFLALVVGELNHSCIEGVCPADCDAYKNAVVLPETETVSPVNA